MVFTRQLVKDTHSRRLTVMPALEGWDVIEEEDATIRRYTRRHDWHRVERDIRLFELTVLALVLDGWVEDPALRLIGSNTPSCALV